MSISTPISFVFVSYARTDHSFVEPLKVDLYEQGITIWVDKEDIQPAAADWEESLRGTTGG